MKILGIDYGERRIGLSLADTDIGIAFPYKVIYNKKGSVVIAELKKIIAKEGVEKIVIGLPLAFDFSETQESKKIRKWATLLAEQLKVAIDFENEFLTSQEAQKRFSALNQKIKKEKSGIKDKTASVIILQAYLDKLMNKI